MDISKFGKGGKTPPWYKKDPRDYRLEVAAGAAQLTEEYSLRDKITKIKDQNGSLSCVGQGFSLYAEILNFIETGQKIQLSARDIYSSIFLPAGGAYAADAAKKVCNSGIVPEEMAASYENGKPPTEAFMRQRSDIDEADKETGMTYLAKKFVTWKNNSFEWYRQAIHQGHGCTMIVKGNDSCWGGADIKVPDLKDCTWSHEIVGIGWRKRNGKDVLEIANSWGTAWGDKGFGWLPKEYIEAGLVVSPITLIDLPNDTYNQLKSQIFKIQEQIRILAEKIKQFIQGRAKK